MVQMFQLENRNADNIFFPVLQAHIDSDEPLRISIIDRGLPCFRKAMAGPVGRNDSNNNGYF